MLAPGADPQGVLYFLSPRAGRKSLLLIELADFCFLRFAPQMLRWNGKDLGRTQALFAPPVNLEPHGACAGEKAQTCLGWETSLPTSKCTMLENLG